MRKKVIYIISILVIVLIIGILIYNYVQSNTKKIDNTTNNAYDIDIYFSDEKIKIDKDSQLDKMYSKLNEYGEEIYKMKEYINYNKRNDVYFISLSDMNKMYEYDISMFVGEDGTVCDTDLSGIYFDTEHKINNNQQGDMGTPLILTLIKCSKDELPE